MDRMIYLSMSGAKAAMQRQDTLANNLANASTTGFRAELQAFRAVPVQGSGASTRVFALETTIGHDDSPGPVAATGRSLDVAVAGASWLSVQALDGSEAYTRAGSLDVSADGTLVTRSGLQVLGDGGPIQLPPGGEPSIAADGTVNVRLANGTSSTAGRLKLVTPETRLVRGDDGLFRAAGGDPLDADTTARLQDGALEGSNVSPVENMVAMIAAARQFEAQMKLMQTAEADEKGGVAAARRELIPPRRERGGGAGACRCAALPVQTVVAPMPEAVSKLAGPSGDQRPPVPSGPSSRTAHSSSRRRR